MWDTVNLKQAWNQLIIQVKKKILLGPLVQYSLYCLENFVTGKIHYNFFQGHSTDEYW